MKLWNHVGHRARDDGAAGSRWHDAPGDGELVVPGRLRHIMMPLPQPGRERPMRPDPILGLSAPSFVIVAVALTLTLAVLAGEAESRRASGAVPAAAGTKPAGHEATRNEVGPLRAQRQLVATGHR